MKCSWRLWIIPWHQWLIFLSMLLIKFSWICCLTVHVWPTVTSDEYNFIMANWTDIACRLLQQCVEQATQSLGLSQTFSEWKLNLEIKNCCKICFIFVNNSRFLRLRSISASGASKIIWRVRYCCQTTAVDCYNLASSNPCQHEVHCCLTVTSKEETIWLFDFR